MCVACLERLSLEDENGLHVSMDVIRGLEFLCALEILNAELKHVENVAVENTPKYQVVRSLLLVTAHGKQAAVILDGLVLKEARVFEGQHIMRVADQHLYSLTPLHQLQVLHQVVDRLTRLAPLHDHQSLGILGHFSLFVL